MILTIEIFLKLLLKLHKHAHIKICNRALKTFISAQVLIGWYVPLDSAYHVLCDMILVSHDNQIIIWWEKDDNTLCMVIDPSYEDNSHSISSKEQAIA